MNLDKVYVFDIETTGLLDTVDHLHVLSVGYKDTDGSWQIKSTNKKEDVFKIFSNPNNILVGHNIICYDLPALKIIYPDIVINAKVVDTLPLSWYLYNERPKHSLESWGETFGTEETKKVAIEDWNNLSYEEYVERCEGDIRINVNLWVKFLSLLRSLYLTDEELLPVIRYCNFKAETLSIQENNKIFVDIEQCKKNLAFLEEIIAEKTEELKKILPKIPKVATVNFPKKGLYKADGSLSVAGEKYLTYVNGCGLPLDYEGPIQVIKDYIEPNPQSTSQVKDFLLSKGWKPKIFKDGANGRVAQLRNDDKELCPSIIKLAEKIPELKALEGLSVAQHRAGYLKAFLSCADDNGCIIAGYSGMAKTFRVKHTKPICNLPANNSQYGELIRKVLIAPPGQVFVNADLSSLEDKTKQCCIFPFDPEYVSTLNKPGYDAHLTIGQKAGFLSEDDVHFFKWYKSKDKDEKDLQGKYIGMSKEELSAEFGKVSKIRSASKTVNYAATYGASPKKIAETADISMKEAETLHKAYWDQNWSVKHFAESLEVKTVEGKDWIYSPFSKLWLLLTSDHIKFSAVNQNFGAKVFDTLLYFLIQRGIKPIMSIHDEVSFYIPEGKEEWATQMIDESMVQVNRIFDQPIKFESGPEFAKSYGDVH
jgi:DNA polymerase I-like protein with 3'-5' exonuclease and polymerase domains